MSKYHLQTIRQIAVVIILTIFALLVCSKAFGQHVGGNAVNFFQYSTYEDWENIIEDSDTISFRYRFDKDSNRVKMVEFYQLCQANGVYMWLTLTSDMNPERTASELKYLFDNGVTVNVLELGNEEYSEVIPKMDFEAYKNLFEPVIQACDYPVIFTLCAPPRPLYSGVGGARRDHQLWHDALKEYLSDKGNNYGINWHIYFNGNDLPVLQTKPAQRVYTQSFYQDLYDYYSALYSQAYTSDLWDLAITYINQNYPDRYVSISEFGAVAEGDGETSGGAGEIKNTLAYAEVMYLSWCKYRWQFNTMDIHSFLAITGMISPSKKPDLFTGNQERVEYFAYQMMQELPRCSELTDMEITDTGTYYFWFTEDYDPVITSRFNLNFETHYVTGEYPYSSAGYTEWMANTTPPNKEIQGVNVVNELLTEGFGYVKITTECYDSTYNEITYVTNPEWTKCQRPLWKWFKKNYCSTQPQYLEFITPKTVVVCE